MSCKLGCGICCKVVKLTITQTDYERMAFLYGTGDKVHKLDPKFDWSHVLGHFRPISRGEALRINPYLEQNSPPHAGNTFYTCDWYNQETKLCKHYNDRPPICRDYPFYGKQLTIDEKWYTPDCGYIEDVGKTAEEVTGHNKLEANGDKENCSGSVTADNHQRSGENRKDNAVS